MKIGITSQNFRTITGHAGKTRRFLVYNIDQEGNVEELPRLDLPREMSLHEYHGEDHPLFDLDLVVTAGSGEGFRKRLRAHGVEVIATSESDPGAAVMALAKGELLRPAASHEHVHEGVRIAAGPER